MTQQEKLEVLRGSDWVKIRSELIRYAEKRLTVYRWKTAQGLPKGCEAPDVALLAIEKTWNAVVDDDTDVDRREWNTQKHPDLLAHLKSAVDSELWNLLHLKEHLGQNYSGDLSSEDAAVRLEHEVDHHRASEDPESKMLATEAEREGGQRLSKVLAALHRHFKNDRVVMQVLQSFESQSYGESLIKHQAVAVATGLSIEQVRNAVKKIKRAAIEIDLEVKRKEAVNE